MAEQWAYNCHHIGSGDIAPLVDCHMNWTAIVIGKMFPFLVRFFKVVPIIYRGIGLIET